MTNRTSLIAIAALAALTASPAVAADMAVKAPPPVVAPVPVYNWTSCYVGGYGGGLWAHKDWTNVTAGGLYLGGHDVDGGLGGVQVGCDYQTYGNWVFGIRGNYGWVSAKGSNVNLVAPTDLDQTRINDLAAVTGRIGYSWGRLLTYIQGGGAWERDSYLVTTIATGAPFAVSNETRGGYALGVGAEYAFTNCVSGLAEYDYYGFGTRTDPFVTAAGAVLDYSIKENKSVLLAGLNLRLGPGGCGWSPAPAAVPVVTK
jgi:outer membrane immunogenic protein